MKGYKMFAAFAIIAYMLLIALFIVLLDRFPTYSKGNVIIKGDNNTVIYFDGSWRDDYQLRCAERILKIRKVGGDNKFDVDDSKHLVGKIMEYADKHKVPYLDAFVIVNVESGFKKSAYNKGGKAYGLCQITRPCLDEYNYFNGTDYDIEAMMDIDINLEVGFWYYKRLMSHYSKFPAYGISTADDESTLRDCYIAYNIGITKFKELGVNGRNSMRNGVYPVSMYGSKKGDEYAPIKRFYKVYNYWLDKN